MNEKSIEEQIIEEYVNDLLDKEKYDGIKVIMESGNTWFFRPEHVLDARYKVTKKGIMIHVEDDRMVGDFPASDIKSFSRFKKGKLRRAFTDTMKIIEQEKEFEKLIIICNDKEREINNFISIDEVHDLNEDLVVIKYWEYTLDEGLPVKQVKILYLYDSNIIGVEFTKKKRSN